MKRLFAVLVLAVLLPAGLFAQTDSLRLVYTVSGSVADLSTRRPIESVHVSIPSSNFATVTNADGEFTIKSDRPIREVTFSYVGYKTVRQIPTQGPMRVYLVPESFALDPAMSVAGDARTIVEAAVDRVAENYVDQAELLECFYRETVRKRQRYTYISEAVARVYKTAYSTTNARDRAALEKSRVLLSQRRTDTLSIKMQGGPTQAVTHDVVKNPDLLLARSEMYLYNFEMMNPAMIDDRPQFVVKISPRLEAEYALYDGIMFIDMETLAFTRIEMSLDMSDRNKATRLMLVKKPLSLRFTPQELSLVVTYRPNENGKMRMAYIRTTLRFRCDWRRRLFGTNYTVVNELVVTDLRQPVVAIDRAEMFRTSDILEDKASEFLDPDFWKDYNIIEPSESLENAVERLRRR
ncbi:MAG: carboxypeptidase-like regulatory domain-containing protein [Bacteroidales bacterium]|nr:carboxypeptidase-like regulatory domain-containing protein [Bacteroidales bacterium]